MVNKAITDIERSVNSKYIFADLSNRFFSIFVEIMDTQNIKYDCSRGCSTLRADDGELTCKFKNGCCKLTVYDWLEGIPDEETKNLFEVRFKNTRKLYFRNESGVLLVVGDLVVVEAANGHDVGIVTANGPIIRHQLKRNDVEPATYEFKKNIP